MAVGFISVAGSFQALCEHKIPEDRVREEGAKLLEIAPLESTPSAINPEFQNELTGLYFGYRYSVLRAQSGLVQQLNIVNQIPQGARQDFFKMAFISAGIAEALKPLQLQILQTIDEMKRFEDRIVVLLEQQNPPLQGDPIREMQNRLLDGLTKK